MFWISAILIVLLGATVLYFWIAKPSKSTRNEVSEPKLTDLRTGDRLGHLGQVYTVEAVVVLNEGDFRWQELLLRSSDSLAWLRIESAGTLRLTLLEPPVDALVEGSPPANVVRQGITYRLDEEGTAYITRYGDAPEVNDIKSGQKLDYHHYLADKGLRLSIERIERGPYLWRFGREITPDELSVEIRTKE